MIEIKVTQEGLEKLMNLQYKFHSLEAKLEHMSPQVKAEFAELYGAVKDLFKAHREEEDKAYSLKSEVLDKIQEEHGFQSIWSMSEVSDMNAVFGYVEAVEYEGNTEVVGTEVTWLQLWAIADRLIKQSGDFHHIFVENFHKKTGDIVHTLVTGS